MSPHKYAFKNYIFDFFMEPWSTSKPMSRVQFYGILWLRSTNAYGASYTGEGLRLRYKELVQQAEEDLAKEKQVAYPEIDLTVIFCTIVF